MYTEWKPKLEYRQDAEGPYGWFTVEVNIWADEPRGAVHVRGPAPRPPGVFIRPIKTTKARDHQALVKELLEEARLELWAGGERAISKLAYPRRVLARWQGARAAPSER